MEIKLIALFSYKIHSFKYLGMYGVGQGKPDKRKKIVLNVTEAKLLRS